MSYREIICSAWARIFGQSSRLPAMPAVPKISPRRTVRLTFWRSGRAPAAMTVRSVSIGWPHHKASERGPVHFADAPADDVATASRTVTRLLKANTASQLVRDNLV